MKYFKENKYVKKFESLNQEDREDFQSEKLRILEREGASSVDGNFGDWWRKSGPSRSLYSLRRPPKPACTPNLLKLTRPVERLR